MCETIGSLGKILAMVPEENKNDEYKMLRYFLEMSLEEMSVKFYLATGQWFGNTRHIAAIDRKANRASETNSDGARRVGRA